LSDDVLDVTGGNLQRRAIAKREVVVDDTLPGSTCTW
jgi:hypothetical protein